MLMLNMLFITSAKDAKIWKLLLIYCAKNVQIDKDAKIWKVLLISCAKNVQIDKDVKILKNYSYLMSCVNDAKMLKVILMSCATY